MLNDIAIVSVLILIFMIGKQVSIMMVTRGNGVEFKWLVWS
jgi:hypothetical protein